MIAQIVLAGVIGVAIAYALRAPKTGPYEPPATPVSESSAPPRVPICEERDSEGRIIFMLCRPEARASDFRAVGVSECNKTGQDLCLVFFWTDPDRVPTHVDLQGNDGCVAEFIRTREGVQSLMQFDKDDC